MDSTTRWIGLCVACALGLGAAWIFVLRPQPVPAESSATPPFEPLDLEDRAQANAPAGLAVRLHEAPPPLQPRFVRALEDAPPEAKVPALAGFLARPDALHPGALLESAAQLKRAGPSGAQALLDLYDQADPARRAVILQMFEVAPAEGDAALLRGWSPDPTDPLAPRWEQLRGN